jgi:cation diffusion facilitator CzcD-associated flavoprotein CzcO
MKRKIDQSDYDICIIGAGAYGFPLAAHVKRMGKKAIHLGGVTQLLFGIKGRRWVDNPILFYPYINLYNEHWTYPSLEDKPTGAGKVEDACYW